MKTDNYPTWQSRSQSPRVFWSAPRHGAVDFRFHGACVPWFKERPEKKSMWMRSTKAFNTHWKNQESRNLALKEQQYQILKAKDTRALGTSLLIIPELRVLVLTKRHVGSGNEIGIRWAVLLTSHVKSPWTKEAELLQTLITDES